MADPQEHRPRVVDGLNAAQWEGLACCLCGVSAVAGPPMVPFNGSYGLFRCEEDCVEDDGSDEDEAAYQ